MFVKDQLQYEALALPDRVALSDADSLGAANAYYENMRKRHSVRDFPLGLLIERSLRHASKLLEVRQAGPTISLGILLPLLTQKQNTPSASPPRRKKNVFMPSLPRMNGSKRWSPSAPMHPNPIWILPRG